MLDMKLFLIILLFTIMYIESFQIHGSNVHISNIRSQKKQSNLFSMNSKFPNDDIILNLNSNRSVKSYYELLALKDVLNVSLLAFSEFSEQCKKNPILELILFLEILSVYLPKLILPFDVMGHQVLALKTIDNELIGLADLSLQTSSGSLAALDRSILPIRLKKYRELKPYLCNFMISKSYRRKGYGKQLILLIEKEVIKMGHNELYLHADSKSVEAITFYLSLNYQPVKAMPNNILFMKKVLI